MAISEESRHEMYVKLEEVLGAQVANTVMEHLPPVGRADVATKRDLEAQSVLMRRDLDAVQVLMGKDLDAVQVLMRKDLDAVQVLMKRDLDAVQALMKQDLDAQIAFVRGDLVSLGHQLRAEIRGDINRLMLWLFPTILTGLGLAFAAAKIS